MRLSHWHLTQQRSWHRKKFKQTAGRDQLGDFAPKFAELNDDVLFGEVWSRTDRLGLRDRSLVTITSLISQGITDSSLTYHLQTARQNGITRTEIAEIITHIGFYAGWPKAWTAFRLAKEVWAADTTGEDARAAFQRQMIFPVGEPNTAYAQYFTGNSYLAPVSREQVAVSNVTFEPGCRNNWHIHHAEKGGGQMLIGVAGRGWYQEEGKAAVEILPGTVIHIPAGVKHWHAPRPTAGSPIWPSRCRARRRRTSGSNPSRTRSTANCNRVAAFTGIRPVAALDCGRPVVLCGGVNACCDVGR